jgi:predicted RNase H-like HicB family nuclease
MLTKYIASAMVKAKYEILQEDSTFYGEIPGFEGVYANAIDLETCRDELEEVLEEWLFFRISRNMPVPTVNGMKLKINKIAVSI